MHELSATYPQTRRRFYGVTSVAMLSCFFASPLLAQSSPDAQTIVQPGAPGQPTRKLSADTRPTLPAKSAKDVEFMQGMIHHHTQAVEMVALIEKRTTNKEVRVLGSRIAASQADEMAFMRRWLAIRGEKSEMKMAAADNNAHDSHGVRDSPGSEMLMPGMLTAKQMAELKAAKGADFDRLFLAGMIQHHRGALDMVRDLFNTSGAGQDAEIFSFATDVDTGQLAEIKTMQNILGQIP